MMSRARIQFKHQGRQIYEWEQSIDEVNIYISPPPNITKDLLDIKISSNHLIVGLKGADPFIDEDTGGQVKVQDSTWTLSDGEINITLQKLHRAEPWLRALAGRVDKLSLDNASTTNNQLSEEEVKKEMMLQRFQEEHPTFDFSNAEFNGLVPDAQTFMGGVKYS